MPIPFMLDGTIEQLEELTRHSEPQVAARSVYVSVADIRRHLPEILEHKWYLSERLERDAGVGVAAVDFFENVQPRLRRLTEQARAKKRQATAEPSWWKTIWASANTVWAAANTWVADDSPESIRRMEAVLGYNPRAKR
jgi:hypothetical protein